MISDFLGYEWVVGSTLELLFFLKKSLKLANINSIKLYMVFLKLLRYFFLVLLRFSTKNLFVGTWATHNLKAYFKAHLLGFFIRFLFNFWIFMNFRVNGLTCIEASRKAFISLKCWDLGNWLSFYHSENFSVPLSLNLKNG